MKNTKNQYTQKIRDSRNAPLRVDWLPGNLAGAVGMTLCPGKRSVSKYGGHRWERDLELDLDRLCETHRTELLVSLIEDLELQTHGVPGLWEACARRRLEVWRYPIRDVNPPRDLPSVRTLVREILDRAMRGERVVIHCIGGLGRTGCIAGCLLVEQGHTAREALAILASVRSRNCPETEAQRSFIFQYEDARQETP